MTDLYARSEPARAGERVLFWIPGGMPLMLEVEGTIAAALKLRGVEVQAVICDGPFVGCIKRELVDDVPVARWQDSCAACSAATSSVLDRIGIPYSHLGDFVPPDTRSVLCERASRVTWDNLDALEVAGPVRSSVVRFLKGASLSGHEEIVPEYAYSALVCASAAETAIREFRPSRIFMSHGVYVDWGPALAVALRRGIPVAGWMASYLDAHFYLRHIDDPLRIDFHNMSRSAWRAVEDLPLSAAQEEALRDFLMNRYQRKISFDMKGMADYSGDTDVFRRRYVGRSDRPVWGIMAHINWDSAAEYAPMAYSSFDDWIIDTVEHISSIDNVNWLLKIHPAEAWDGTERGVQRLIEDHFPTLPSNIHIIGAEERISPLDFYNLIDGGVTVYGTSGLELALLGKPVILAGEAHYGAKGFTHDGLNREAYHQLLARASDIGPLSTGERLRAMKYAYAYFVRRQVPLNLVHDPKSWWKFPMNHREALIRGHDPFVDFICERILDGRDFVMDDELSEHALAYSSLRETAGDVLADTGSGQAGSAAGILGRAGSGGVQ